jgi:hypothetical protein
MSGSCFIGRAAAHYNSEGLVACVYPCMLPNRLLRLKWDETKTTLENHNLIARHLDAHGTHLDTCVYRPRP